jgi:hypothetical protein
MHDAQTGKTERLAGQALEARPQREVLTFTLLYHQFSFRIPRRPELPPVDTHRVRVVARDAKRREHGAEWQALRILPSTHHRGQSFPRVRIERMPQPPRPPFGPDQTPPLIQLGGACWSDADGAGARTIRGSQRGVDGLKYGGFVLIRR